MKISINDRENYVKSNIKLGYLSIGDFIVFI